MKDDGTYKCRLNKRTQSPYEGPCKEYKHLSQTTFTLKEVEKLLKEATKPPPIKQEVKFDPSIPMELTEIDMVGGQVPRDLHFRFLSLDFDHPEQPELFMKEVLETVFSNVDWDTFRDYCIRKGWYLGSKDADLPLFMGWLFDLDDLVAVQADLAHVLAVDLVEGDREKGLH